MTPVHDDWRLQFDLEPGTGVSGLLAAVREHEIDDDVRARLGNRVVVSHDASRLFLYADSDDALREAERVVRPLLEQQGVAGRAHLSRWHPEEERWEDPSVPLPSSEEERRAERDRLAADEAAESESRGYPEWEVRVETPSASDARAFAETLRDEGLPLVRRSHYVLVGAPSEAEAQALAGRLRDEAPEGSTLAVEGNGQEAWRTLHPFAVFGGLGV
jgi:hypothetical protein